VTLGVHMGTLRGAGAVAVGQPLAAQLMNVTGGGVHFWLPESWNIPAGGERSPVAVEARPARGMASKLYLENVAIRRAIRRGSIAALFSVGDTSLPACGVPHLLMVQNAYLAYHPGEWWSADRRLVQKMTLVNMYFRLGLPTVSRFAVQTQTMKARLAERWKLDEERIVVIPSSIRDVFVATEPAPAADPPYVCFIGSPMAHKNHAVVAEVLALLGQRGIRMRCRLTGTPHDAPRLTARARQLGVQDQLEFAGPLPPDAVCGMLQQATALIMPSRMESFGLPLFEAMAVGCPVIAADRDFAREACGNAALYADPDSSAGFADHVAALVEEPALRARLAAAGRARFRAAHRTWADIASDYLDVVAAMNGPRLTLQEAGT
jgi:glycosyltransferase involved in cell wall biosynthesis